MNYTHICNKIGIIIYTVSCPKTFSPSSNNIYEHIYIYIYLQIAHEDITLSMKYFQM